MTSSVHSLDVAAFRDNADAILTAATQGDARVPGVVAMVTDLQQMVEADERPDVILETALPVKFSETIVEAIGEEPEVPERFQGILDSERRWCSYPQNTVDC